LKKSQNILLSAALLISSFAIGVFLTQHIQISRAYSTQTLSKTSTCKPVWKCSTWSFCSQDGKQSKICVDKNNCAVTAKRPTQEKSCKPKIKITGLEGCVVKTNLALDLLRSKAKSNYNNVIKYVGAIECTESQSGMHVEEKPPRYQVGKATVDAGTIWYAGTIVHDACHSKQYSDYLAKNPSANVPADVYTGKNAEAQCVKIQHAALGKIGATQATLDYVDKVLDSEYWNIEYDKRWW